jgi:hypothetical protein
MNILIKLMSVVALVLAPWFARVHGLRVDDATAPVVGMVMDALRWLTALV